MNINMNAVLRNPSLLTEIFSCFDPQQMDKSSCLSAALTCTDFTAPALDVLWRDLPNFNPVVMLIPEVESVVLYPPDEFLWHIRQPLNPRNLTILKAYTRRVRTLHLRHSHIVEEEILGHVESNIMIELLSIFDATQPLFPCLRDLRIDTRLSHNCRLITTSAYLRLFLSPMLSRISFEVPSRSEDDESVGIRVPAPSIALFLQNLQNHFSAGPPPVTRIFLGVPANASNETIDILKSLTTLEELEVSRAHDSCRMTFSVMSRLAHFQSLKKLSIAFDEHDEFMAHMIWLGRLRNSTFATLTCFDLSGDNMTLSSLLQSFKFPVLEKFTYTCAADRVDEDEDRDIEQTWENLLYNVPSSFPSLISLKLGKMRAVGNTDEEPLTLTWSSFSPLLDLWLVELEIHHPKVDYLSNEDVQEMASSWADLEVLQIDTEYQMDDINHESLLIIATQLPKLRSFNMSLYLGHVSLDDLSALDFSKFNSPLESLTVTSCETLSFSCNGAFTKALARAMFSLAQFLDALFPCLAHTKIHYTNLDGTVNVVGEPFHEFMAGIKAARSRGRASMSKSSRSR